MNSYAWKKAAAAIFFPNRTCLGCGSLAINSPLCSDCTAKALKLRHCPSCASFIASTETQHYLCPACRADKPSFKAAYAALPYEGQVRNTLLAFKYHRQTGERRALGALLMQVFGRYFTKADFDAIVPVPLHENRLSERGYNQALLLADIVSGETGIALMPQLLERQKETQPLIELGRRQRMQELKGAFAASETAAGKRILLIDDIFTTGATAELCSISLLKKAAESVCVLTVAAGHISDKKHIFIS